VPFARTPRPSSLLALKDAAPEPFWLDRPDRPEAASTLVGDENADLAVVGAGYTGLWTALLAKEADPGRDVVVLEGATAGHAASGRNGGFCVASLTHGLGNGLTRYPDELTHLVTLGRQNLDAIEATVARYGIDCSFERTGGLDVATEPHQVDDLRELVDLGREHGDHAELLDTEQVQQLVASPLFLAGARDVTGTAMVDPARLAWGLRRACLGLGVRIYENTAVTALAPDGAGMRLTTPFGSVRAARVALGTNAFPPLLRRLKHYVVPVYDHALMTEPLGAEARAAIGWLGREGIGDSGNQFHYFRLTDDDRILFGGYDAVYHWNNGFGPQHEQNAETFGLLAEHFFQMFPQLEGLRFTHRWGGAIDTCSRFSAFWGTANEGRVAYSIGYTGLGVAATRFGAAVMLDLLDAQETERTRLEMVRSKPVPFPPEPARSMGINLTRSAMAKADRSQGRRNAWLRTLDRLGLGFDS
jgi:glycine/D-amino acid oxidase-like deaminating enzyme